jgi:uncharacterized OB-fold protein
MTTDLGPQAAHERALAEGRLMLQRCDGCARHVFPPRRLCPYCGGSNLAWVAADGCGTVHATTVVARPAKHGGPYGVVLVDLDEGVRMMSRVDELPPEDVRIGMRVKARVLSSQEPPLVVFVPT